jgi:hypothetical protein
MAGSPDKITTSSPTLIHHHIEPLPNLDVADEIIDDGEHHHHDAFAPSNSSVRWRLFILLSSYSSCLKLT